MALPRLSAQQPIVTTGGKPSSPFLQFMEEARKAQEATDAQQGDQIAALESLQQGLQAAVDQINEALMLAGLAIELADGAAGGTARSATDAGGLASVTTTYQAAAQVDLLTVSAGELIFGASNFLFSLSADLPYGVPYYFEFRIIEVDNGVDNGTVYSGSATIQQNSAIDIVTTNTSAVSLAAFTDTRTTTGSVSYRVEARTTATVPVTLQLIFNLFARRA